MNMFFNFRISISPAPPHFLSASLCAPHNIKLVWPSQMKQIYEANEEKHHAIKSCNTDNVNCEKSLGSNICVLGGKINLVSVFFGHNAEM